MSATQTTPRPAPTSIKVIVNPEQFYRIDFTKQNGKMLRNATHKSMRVSIPLSIQSAVNTALIYDKRRMGFKPTEVDVYSQLVGIGFLTVEGQSAFGGKIEIDESALEVPEVDKIVVWIDNNDSEKVKLQFRAFNIQRQKDGLARVRSIEGYIVALLRIGLANAETKTIES